MRRIISLGLLALALVGCNSRGVTLPNQQAAYAQNLTAAKSNIIVWVNTESGVYHCPGTRWYGRTKQGEYMTQKEAQTKGNRPAYGKICG